MVLRRLVIIAAAALLSACNDQSTPSGPHARHAAPPSSRAELIAAATRARDDTERLRVDINIALLTHDTLWLDAELKQRAATIRRDFDAVAERHENKQAAAILYPCATAAAELITVATYRLVTPSQHYANEASERFEQQRADCDTGLAHDGQPPPGAYQLGE